MELRHRGPMLNSNAPSQPYHELKDKKSKRVVTYAVVGSEHLDQFSEDRARDILKRLTAHGPRPSGSENLENKAFNIIHNKLREIETTVEAKGVNRLEIDVQRPSGCFDLKFLSSFTLCYHRITNTVAPIGPQKGPAEHALMLNCHFNTMPDTPGATDDAVSCAIMMDVLSVLSQSNESLPHDVVFLFNGAEENFLQGAHGFIEQHSWRHTIRAFINLEGTGSGRTRNSWLLQTYLENAPHPFCSVLAQEIFQSGIIPSDTDFRIFRDYGRVSGLDIAYTKNGWVYHTEFDEEWRIEAGAIQRAGENVLAVVKAILKSPYLAKPSSFEEANRFVFYDVVGLFTIYYSIGIGQAINYFACVLVLALVMYRIRRGFYTVGEMITAFTNHLVAMIVMAVTMLAIVSVVVYLDLTMCWYNMPELVGPLYVVPIILAGMTVHTYYADETKIRNPELVQYDSILIFFAGLLFLLTFYNIASAFFVLNYLVFPFCKDFLIGFINLLGLIDRVTPRVLLYTQLFCFVPVIVFSVYAISQCVDFFVPVMGRLGDAINPEFVIGPIALVIASSLVLFVHNLFYISRRMNYIISVGVALFVIFFFMVATTKLGVPYSYSEKEPRLRRIIALHTNRTVYDFEGNAVQKDNDLFVQSLDYRGTSDLPAHSFLQGSTPPKCDGIVDEYCRMPYYTAIHELFPPEKALWVTVPSPAKIPFPIDLSLISRERIGSNQLNCTFELRGGLDKMSLHITPLSGYKLEKWSFTDIDLDEFGRRTTYFVFLTYGAVKPDVRSFWVLMESYSPVPGEPENTHNVEISVASHHAHGIYQYSDTLAQLRGLIAACRLTPEQAVGWWKWGTTMIGGVSEIVVHTF